MKRCLLEDIADLFALDIFLSSDQVAGLVLLWRVLKKMPVGKY